MSEEALKKEFGLDEPKDDDVVDDSQADNDDVDTGEPEAGEQTGGSDIDDGGDDEIKDLKHYQDSKEEAEKARADGWLPFDEFVKNGGKPQDWKTAKHFNEYGQFVEKQRKLEQTFDQRLESVNKLYQMQLKSLQERHTSLEQQKREAVENGDWDAVQNLDKKIMENQGQAWEIGSQVAQSQQQAQQQELEVEKQWEARNQWVYTQDPNSPDYKKAQYAQQRYAQMIQQGVPVQQRLQTLENEISQMFGANPNRTKPAPTDGKQGSRSSNKVTSFADLPDDVKQQWDKFGKEMFPNKKAFIQAYVDSQKDSKRG